MESSLWYELKEHNPAGKDHEQNVNEEFPRKDTILDILVNWTENEGVLKLLGLLLLRFLLWHILREGLQLIVRNHCMALGRCDF